MAGLAWVLFAVVLGGLLVRRFAGLEALEPRWAAWLLIFGAGAAAGIALTSCLFFLAVALVPRLAVLLLGIEIAAAAWAAWDIFRRRKPSAVPAGPRAFPLNALVAAALALVLLIATGAMAAAWQANPQGNWDAWSIWNLRARFLAGGTFASRAWSPLLSATHPEYPLLTSAFVAQAWAYSHSFTPVVPIAASYLFLLALLALATGAMAAWRSRSLGLLCGLALAGTPSLLHEVPAQYADVPLACYMAGAVLLALLDRPVLAGIFAGLAAWTKDEGLLFLAVFLLASLLFRRRHMARLAMGAAPGLILALVFKLALARGTTSLLAASGPGLLHRLADPGRYGQILGAFAGEIGGMAWGWYHPILPLLALAAALRFDRERRRDLLFGAGLGVFLLLGYFAVFVITPNDLSWQLQTSLGRLLVQFWPILVLACFAGLRAPEAWALASTPERAAGKGRQKAKA